MCAQYVYSKATRYVYIIWSDDDNNHPDTVVKNASFVDRALLKNFINITPPENFEKNVSFYIYSDSMIEHHLLLNCHQIRCAVRLFGQ